MTNDKFPMTNQCQMTKSKNITICHLDFVIDLSFVIGNLSLISYFIKKLKNYYFFKTINLCFKFVFTAAAVRAW